MSPDRKAAALARLQRLLSTVPPACGSWTYDRTVAFKKAVAEAGKVARNERSTAWQIEARCALLETYHSTRAWQHEPPRPRIEDAPAVGAHFRRAVDEAWKLR